MNLRGKFITFEGGEGSGKTTALRELGSYLDSQSISYMITREPGGIEISEKIRGIILDTQHTAMDARTEALLYAAARRQHLVEKVKPALDAGVIVLCDRFVDSSLAYQGYARGLGMDEVWNINQFAIDSLMPEMTFYLDVDPQVGLSRIAASQEREVNRLDLEKIEFHHKVREAYQLLAEQYPCRIITINAEQTSIEVVNQLIFEMEKRVLKDIRASLSNNIV
ncbi:dTMP kinase [Paenibacillus crassostreae]|uniref:Thymidylate kinase n=1 Tax=Paenibacillus crassostreae TaxID=1763538 RepID=A0A167AM79_9BACL|nr:dTMP kinase [Paenibacillus crassostreae]AOZ92839.1 dTMP kinase [Paenibacillus crassostreae]OAB71197.1 thymidylate kinase [Paenibacillus crassostreae]